MVSSAAAAIKDQGRAPVKEVPGMEMRGGNIMVRHAVEADRPAIDTLLAASGLPRPGPSDAPVRFLVAERDGAMMGVAGWEIHGDHALLRSVAVVDAARGTRLGTTIVGAALDSLRQTGVADITLVTLTAEAFFRRFGFSKIAREDVAKALRASREYDIHECAGGSWMRRSPRS
jgi:amino-acid N-acetyltransferase